MKIQVIYKYKISIFLLKYKFLPFKVGNSSLCIISPLCTYPAFRHLFDHRLSIYRSFDIVNFVRRNPVSVFTSNRFFNFASNFSGVAPSFDHVCPRSSRRPRPNSASNPRERLELCPKLRFSLHSPLLLLSVGSLLSLSLLNYLV